MINATNAASGLALDVNSISDLKLQAKTDPKAALTLAAQQFEAVFMQMMLKSMRDTVDQDGVFDSEQTKEFTSMLDQQLAQSLAGKGLGLADVMVKQLQPPQPSLSPLASQKSMPLSASTAAPAALITTPAPVSMPLEKPA